MNVEVGTLEGPVASGGSIRPVASLLPDKERTRLFIYGLLLLLDCLAIVLGFGLVAAGYLTDDYMTITVNSCVVLLPIFALVALNGQAYTISVILRPTVGMFRAVTALFVGVTAVLLIAFYLKASAELSRFVLGLGTVLASGLLVTFRAVFGRIARRMIGPNPLGEVVIRDGVTFTARVSVPVIDADEHGICPDIADPLMLDRLGRYLKNAERVVVVCPPERRMDWAIALKGANVTGEIVAVELDEVGAIGTSRFDGHTTLSVSRGPLALRSRAAKRAFDLAVGGLALILLSPLLAVIALAIKLDTPGPILFVQPRLGRGNRLFNMFKFRSMRADLCDREGTQSTLRDDERITRVGRFIRSTSIDELPQILNVLLGDMSIVGPRPHALGSTAGTKLFWEVDTRYWHRHASKPGITGLAQVRGYRGATHESVDLTNRLQADLEYLAGWTIWRDISILFATFRVMVHRNAF